MNPLNADAWLNLGVPGAALFIIAIVVVLLFRQQSKSIDKLCTKLDSIVTSFADNNLKLNEVIIGNDRDQKQVINQIAVLQSTMQDVQCRVIGIEARVNQKGGSEHEQN